MNLKIKTGAHLLHGIVNHIPVPIVFCNVSRIQVMFRYEGKEAPPSLRISRVHCCHVQTVHTYAFSSKSKVSAPFESYNIPDNSAITHSGVFRPFVIVRTLE